MKKSDLLDKLSEDEVTANKETTKKNDL